MHADHVHVERLRGGERVEGRRVQRQRRPALRRNRRVRRVRRADRLSCADDRVQVEHVRLRMRARRPTQPREPFAPTAAASSATEPANASLPIAPTRSRTRTRPMSTAAARAGRRARTPARSRSAWWGATASATCARERRSSVSRRPALTARRTATRPTSTAAVAGFNGKPACATCADRKHCAKNSDCAHKTCFGAGPGTCVSCTDGVKDGNETDTDCGGPLCDAQGKTCGTTQGCTVPADCMSGYCPGGTTCQLRPDGNACTTNAQCLHGACLAVAGGGKVCCNTGCPDQGANSCGTNWPVHAGRRGVRGLPERYEVRGRDVHRQHVHVERLQRDGRVSARGQHVDVRGPPRLQQHGDGVLDGVWRQRLQRRRELRGWLLV